MKTALDYCRELLLKKEVDKFQCSLTNTNQYEMNLEGMDFSLIRSLTDNTLNITVIHDQRKGQISVNNLTESAIREAVETAIELSTTSQQDPDYDIAPQQEAETFVAGPQQPDSSRMYELLKEYSEDVPKLFPAIKLMETTFIHKSQTQKLINSNGIDFTTEQGTYNLSSIFSSREGDKATSFNYTGFALQDLEKAVLERVELKKLMQQSVEHLNARSFAGKFEGDVIIAPDCLQHLLYFLNAVYLGDGALISGTSPYKDKLGKEITSSKFTLAAKPTSPEMAEGYFVTQDGFKAEDSTIIEKGVLRSFLLSQYGSKKTGLERAKNQGDCWVIEPGNKSLAKMIKQVERGLLVNRYSGGFPSPNGDFSGVAKNSYYIENGEIKYPVTETMIAGNLSKVFENIKEISSERVDYGIGIIPYLLTSGVTISGK